jgi:hypothetical protein
MYSDVIICMSGLRGGEGVRISSFDSQKEGNVLKVIIPIECLNIADLYPLSIIPICVVHTHIYIYALKDEKGGAGNNL